MSDKFSPHLRSLALLLITVMIWGSTFPLLKEVVATLSPAVLVGSRFIVAAVAFIPFCHSLTPRLLREGSLLGFVAFLSYLTQVVGLESVSANRAAFITSLNVVMVPLIGWFLQRSIPLKTFVAAGVAFAGIAVMSWEAGVISWGDVWILGCALSYAIYILLMESISPKHPPLQLTAVQLLTIALLGILWAVPYGLDQLSAIKPHWIAIVYLGLIATAFTTWTQTVAQRALSATEAAILYTLEPVFATVFSFWWLAESLSNREVIGAGMILVAMILSQVSLRRK